MVFQGSLFISLKPEQKSVIKSLIGETDVLAVSPTCFRKNAIDQFLVRVKEMFKESASILFFIFT